MKTNKLTTMAICFAAMITTLIGSGCSTTTAEISDDGMVNGKQVQVIAGFSEKDISRSVKAAVDNIIALDRIKTLPGSNRAIVVVKDVINDTTTRGRDAESLAEALGLSLRELLTNSGKIVVYNPAAAQYATVKVNPQYALTGRLTQRILRQDDGDVQIEYNLNLQLIDLATGLEYWQKRIPIRKLADRRNAL